MDMLKENNSEVTMEQIARYNTSTYPTDKFSVIFEFPPKSELDNQIEMEVKSIMTGAVKEHLRRTS